MGPVKGLVFITGASAGIGRALAEAVPFEARVLNLSRRAGPGVHVPVDLADPKGWAVAEAAMAGELAGFRGDRLVFVHSAGTLEPIGFVGEVEPAAYRRQVLLNSAAGQVLGDAFLRHSRGKRARRDLIVLTSGASWSVYEGWSGYCAGKAAADHWVRVVAAEQKLRPDGCRVLSVAPGIIETAMQEQIRAASPRDFPNVEWFRETFADGKSRPPEAVAPEIWALLERDDLESGSTVDLLVGAPPTAPLERNS
jgi:NAD(P)-dependent dehydrogenase (short-subunit alcohol dehydrogenase family)